MVSGMGMKHRGFSSYFVACALWVLSGSAWAYYSPLVFIPTQPLAGQPVAVRVGFGICDMLLVVTPQDRQLVVEGSVLRVTVRGVEAPDLDFCIYPDGYADLDIGPLAAGNYTVEIYRSLLSDPTQIRLVQTGSLGIGQASAISVPAANPVSFALLCLATIFAGAMQFRRSPYQAANTDRSR